jgi:hypothetical protein
MLKTSLLMAPAFCRRVRKEGAVRRESDLPEGARPRCVPALASERWEDFEGVHVGKSRRRGMWRGKWYSSVGRWQIGWTFSSLKPDHTVKAEHE